MQGQVSAITNDDRGAQVDQRLADGADALADPALMDHMAVVLVVVPFKAAPSRSSAA